MFMLKYADGRCMRSVTVMAILLGSACGDTPINGDGDAASHLHGTTDDHAEESAGQAGAMASDAIVPPGFIDPVTSAVEGCDPAAETLSDLGAADPTQLCGRPAYGGQASDESLISMVDAEARLETEASMAANIMTPTEGEVFQSSDSAPEISWESPIASRINCGGSARYAVLGGAPSFLERVESLFVSKALAHCPPLNGDLYFLKFSIPGEPCTHSVLTTEESWQIDDKLWATMAAAGGAPITLSIMSAYLMDNRVVEGPYLPESKRTFTVMP